MSMSVNTISAGTGIAAVMSSPYVSAQQMRVSRVAPIKSETERARSAEPVAKSFGMSEDRIEISAAGRKALEQIYSARSAKSAAQAAPVAPVPVAAEAAATVSLQGAASPAPTLSTAPAEAKQPVEPIAPVTAKETAPAQAAKPAKPAEEAEAPEITLDLPGAATQDEAAAELAAVDQNIEPLTASEDSVSSADLQNMSVSEMRTLVNDGTISRSDMDRELSRREKESEQASKQSEAATQAINKAMESMKDVSNMTGKMSTYNATKQYAAMAQALA